MAIYLPVNTRRILNEIRGMYRTGEWGCGSAGGL